MIRGVGVGFVLMVSVSAWAVDDHVHDERQQDALAHREFAGYHLQVAECLAGGKLTVDQCEGELKKVCKGKASGPHCGMRHSHDL